jgi:Spy/CpxP family protein refolding chaperone
MKINKFSIITGLALGSLVTFTNLATAQDDKPAAGGPRGRGPTVEQRMERLTAELNLTAEQKPKVKAVLEDSQKKREELSNVSREERREKARGIMENESKKLKEILTADQYTKYEKMVRERAAGARRGEGAPAKPDKNGGNKAE